MDERGAGPEELLQWDEQNPEQQSIGMLRVILNGHTYDQAAVTFGLSRTGVERRVKRLAHRLVAEVGVAGMTAHSLTSVRKLRKCRAALEQALMIFDPSSEPVPSVVIDARALDAAVRRVRARNARDETASRDAAMLLVIFGTGGRPREIARLQVRDYLEPDGSVRRRSEWRPEVSFSGRGRPLYFASAALVAAIDEYLAERLAHRRGVGDSSAYRGLDPQSWLFLDTCGTGLSTRTSRRPQEDDLRSERVERVFERILRQAELGGVTPLGVQQTLAARLYSRGADEAHVGEILGVQELRVIRRRFPRHRPGIDELMDDVI